jgi:hypothetical protein
LLAVALARLASYFLLLAQKKVTKEKSTPHRLFPALIQKFGRCGTRPNKSHKTWLVAVLKQVLAKTSQLFKSSQARQQGILKSTPCGCRRR